MPRLTTHQVLLTLYAAVAERFAADDEEEAEEGSAARQAQPDAAAAESAAAFAASLAALQQQQGDDASIAQLAALAQQHAAVLAAIQETAAMAASVRVAAELQQRLADFDAALAAGTYSEAAWIAVELQKGVAAVPGSDDMAAAVAARVEPLQQQLLAGVYGCCRIDPASRLPALIPSPAGSGEGGEAARGGSTEASAAMLAEIWRALQVGAGQGLPRGRAQCGAPGCARVPTCPGAPPAPAGVWAAAAGAAAARRLLP